MKHTMKNRVLCLVLCAAMTLLAACSSRPTASREEPADTPTPAPNAVVMESAAVVEPAYSFEDVAADLDKMKQEAIAQYNREDYSPLEDAVRYNVLWLGFTHVTYGDLDFQMTDFDREYLQAVALNFEKSVESITGHSLDITVYLHFIEETVPLTKIEDDDWLFLAQETAQPMIDRFSAGLEIDTVLTTVQTAGAENQARNSSKAGYGVNYVMLGLETADLLSPMGYSTFDLQEPNPGTYPLADPEIPSLSATAVAVHEWMHQLECLGPFLGIEYPSTHAYVGPSEFPGYQKYTADQNDYDFFEFYKLVLGGKLPYTANGVTRNVGMYPKMWPLTKHGVFDLGLFSIRAADGSGYLTGQSFEPELTISGGPCLWHIIYQGDRRFVLSPQSIPDRRIDLSNAWDDEGNTVGLFYDTGYVDAQSWYLTGAADGSYYIQTPYESGRVITVSQAGQGAALCRIGAAGVQKWFLEPAS